MKTLFSSMAILLLLQFPLPSAFAIDRKVDFEIAFLADNFGAIRLAHPKVVVAGDIFSVDEHLIGTRKQRAEVCIEDFSKHHTYSSASYALLSTHKTRSVQLSASVRAAYNLSGDIGIRVSSNIDNTGLSVVLDSVSVDASNASSAILSDSSERDCSEHRRSYRDDVSPSGTLLVEHAYFFSGQVNQHYSVEIRGQGSGQITAGTITRFLGDVPFLIDIADLFIPNATLSVNGDSTDTDWTVLQYGDNSPLAIGIRPLGINTLAAAELVSLVQDFARNNISLSAAASSSESALLFLNDHPEFDLRCTDSLIRKVFGQTNHSYRDYLTNSQDDAKLVAAAVARILHINTLAELNQNGNWDKYLD